ncbi:MAG: DUF1849 family protein [Alphaproteobacteria bacterium]|nr:DUF1849 family protein [Alphaproteobacteria bacterium]
MACTRASGRFRPALAGLLAGAACLATAAPAAAVDLAPYRAFYELSLANAFGRSAIIGATGAMTAEWLQSCEGWVAVQRLRMVLETDEGQRLDTDLNMSSFESSDGKSYRFTWRTSRNGGEEERFQGTVRRDAPGTGGSASYSEPSETEIDLPTGTMFPIEHTRALVDAAARGDRLLTVPFFDGPRPDKSPFLASALIMGAARPAAATDEGLLNHRWWPVRIAFFERDRAVAEPDFEMTAKLQDNGVVREFVFDYGEFSLVARLSRIEGLSVPDCR